MFFSFLLKLKHLLKIGFCVGTSDKTKENDSGKKNKHVENKSISDEEENVSSCEPEETDEPIALDKEEKKLSCEPIETDEPIIWVFIAI